MLNNIEALGRQAASRRRYDSCNEDSKNFTFTSLVQNAV